MGEVKSDRLGVGEGGQSLGLDSGEDELIVLVWVEVGGGEDRSEEREEVLPDLSVIETPRRRPSRASALKGATHSSPFKNSAVKNKCSRDSVADRTPPYSSVSLTVFNAEPDSVDYTACQHFCPATTPKTVLDRP